MPVLPGSRIRDNGVFGTLVDNPLTAVSTVMNSSDLADLGPIIGDHATITLDPLRQHGDPEIVIVTFHTPAGPVATIERGAYGTTAREHPQGTLWVHAACAEDFIEVLTSATRPPDPYEGQFIYETDTKLVLVFDGTSWVEFGGGGGGGGAPVTLGYAEITATQSGITTETAITGLSVTATIPAGRRIQVTVGGFISRSVADGRSAVRIKQDGVQIQQVNQFVRVAAESSSFMKSVVVTPAAGSHTYTVTLTLDNGSGTTSMVAAPTLPAFILVEDITGDPLPYDPASVPVGQLGYDALTTTIAGITNTPVTFATVNVAVPAGRSIQVTASMLGAAETVEGDRFRLEILQDGVVIQIRDYVKGHATDNFSLDAEVIVSPSDGAHVYTARTFRGSGTGTFSIAADPTFPAFLLVEDITPTPAPSSGAPGSTLGYAQVTANQGSIVGTAVDLTGLSVTVTVPAGRRLKISGKTLPSSTVAGDGVEVSILEGVTTLNQAAEDLEVTAFGKSVHPEAIISPSAGTHTYKLAMKRLHGTGTLTSNAGATFPAFILVEDITGSVWPEGEAVTPGMIASEPWTDFVPVVTQNVNLTLNVAYARYFKLGRLVHLQINTGFLSSGTAGQTVAFTLPIQAAAGGFRLIGNADFFDASTLAKYQLGARLNNSTTVVTFQYASSNSDHLLGSSGVFTAAVTNGDALTLNLMYESAS